MTAVQKSLWLVGSKKHFKTWYQLKEYAEKFRKYDNMTLRQIDEVWKMLIA